MKKLIILLIFINLNIIAQQTYVPDDNFEQALINLGYDSGALDNYVPTANIANLVNLDVSNKSIADLTGIEDFTNLEILKCGSNDLTSLNLTSNTLLTELTCYFNDITSLDVSSNILLEKLYCQYNNLTVLNLDTNIVLEDLNCHKNDLTELDLSMIPTLRNVRCNSNNLEKVNIKNGNNTNIFFFWANNNPNLSCIEVDDENYSTTNWTSIDATTSFSENCYFNKTYIPDDNFEQALIDLGYDFGALDDYVPTQNIVNIVNLDVSNKSIADLTGIEDFTNLEKLKCNSNNLTSLNVVSNTSLTELQCNSNNIVSLNVSSNILLEKLFCQYNDLTVLNLGTNIVLELLYCYRNDLTELDLSMTPTLRNVRCQYNNLESVNIKNGNNTNIYFFWSNNNPNLSCVEVDDENYSTINWTSIDATTSFSENCHFNETYVPDDNFEQALIDLGYDSGALDNYIPTANIVNVVNLDVSNKSIAYLTGIEDFTNLEILNCKSNNLTSLNVTSNTLLTKLYCYSNYIRSLDVSSNVLLRQLFCQTNNLTVLNLGTNIVLNKIFCYTNNLTELDLSMTPILRYLLCQNNNLERVNIKNGNNANIILFRSYNNPNLSCVEVDDENYSTVNWTSIDATTSFSEHWHYGKTYVPDNNFEQTLINLGYDNVLDDYVLTTNIENVISLDLISDNISDLTGIENFTNLENLYCRNNNLSTLDVSQNLALRLLRCQTNNLTSLDLSNNLNLIELRCSRNNITSLDLSNNVNLEVLYCQKNNLVNLDISNNIRLRYFYASKNNLEQLIINNTSNSSTSQYNIIGFNIRYNSNLFCVEVNDETWSTANWPNKDSQTVYSENSCQYPMANSATNSTVFLTKINNNNNNNNNNKQLVPEKLIIANSNESTIYIKTKNNSKISEIKMFDVLGKLIIDLSPNKSEIHIPTNINKGSILFVKARLENGIILNTKFIKL